MADWASLNGQRVVSARVHVPYYGAWVADVMLAQDVAVDPRATLVIGNLTLVGYAVRQGPYAGSWSARIVGGAGGWRSVVPAQAYHSLAGVTRQMILSDAAALVGETVVVGNDAIVGTVFVREVGPASRLLRGVAGTLWYVDAAGVTRVGTPRPGGAILSEFQVVDAKPGDGSYVIATEAVADWQPGRTFTSPTVTAPVTIASVSHEVGGGGKHRITVLSADATVTATPTEPTPLDRTARALRAIIAQEAPLFLYGSWEYVVQATDGITVDIVPIDDEEERLPEIVGCPILPSVLGENVSFAAGATCVVQFLNGNRGRPVVVGGDYNNPPTLGKIAGGGPAAARVGDAATLHFGFATILGIDTLLIGDATGPKYGFGVVGGAGSAVVIPTWGGIPHTAVAGAITTGSSKLQVGG